MPFISRLDHLIYDTRLRLTMPGGVDESVVILDIDERSLGEIGQWPWSRALMAELVAKLFDRYGVAVLGFDIVWAERDTSSGIDTLDSLLQGDLKQIPAFVELYRRLRPTLDNDGRFAGAIRGRPVVLGYYFNSEADAVRVNAIPEPVLPKGTFGGRPIAFTQWVGFTGNLPAYLKSAAAAGHFNPLVDEDGVSRRVPMLLEFDGAYYEPLSLAVVRTYLAQRGGSGRLPPVEPIFGDAEAYAGLERLRVGSRYIPLDETASALIPYRGNKQSFPYVALADVVKDRIDPERLRGRIALVGTTAPGLLDQRATPVSNVYPGVEIHANLISGILSNSLKSKPPFMVGAEVLLLLGAGVALSILIPMLSALWGTIAAFLGAGLLVLLNLIAWTELDAVMPLAAALLMSAALYTVNMAYGYFVESHSKRQITQLFGQYVPPELVDRMAVDPARYTMEPRSAELTILFADVRGFTGISEALRPDELREYINEYLTAMSVIIRSRHRGTLDKYIGDAVMAFWGAPVEDAQHARNAVLAGLDMQKECVALNRRFAARGWPTLQIGVGLNTGMVRVGDMGSRVRRAYTAMGDAVNVASRIEGRTKSYGVGILVGEATRARVPDVVFREVDRVKVKGREEPVTLYEPLGRANEVDENLSGELELWSQALRAYRARQWDDAHARMEKLRVMNPACGLYQTSLQRLAQMRRASPSADWDGVMAFEEK